MARFKDFIFCILLSFAYDSVEANTVSDIKETASLVWEGATGLYDIAKYLWTGVQNSKILDQHTSNDMMDSPISKLTSDESIQIDQHLKYLKAQGDYLMADIHSVKDVIKDKLVHNVAGLHDLNQGISQILTHVYKIDKSFTTFLDYYEANSSTYDSELLSKFATDVVSPGPCGMAARLNNIKALVIGNNKNLHIENIVDLLITHAELFIQYANIRQSQHQLLYNLLHTILITELKAYLIINFSYYLLKDYTGKDYSSFVKQYDKSFKNRISDTIIAFKSAMQVSSREFYRGDPNKHVEDKTYTQLKNVLQVIALNMIDINKADRCSNYCDNDAYKKNDFVTKCFDGGICEKQRTCGGNLVECRYIFKNDLQVCLAPKNSSRRYEYLIDGDEVRKGPNVKCPGDLIDAKATKYYEAWWRRCDYCTCLCEENQDSDRFFSLDIVKSRYEENYVITGARFVKRDNTMYIQIQEGKLLPNGVIDPRTVDWLPLPEKPIKVFTMKWGVGREIGLHDLQARPEEALVGVQFTVTGGFRKRLTLEAHTIKIDYFHGKIVDPRSHIKYIYNEPPAKKKMELKELDLPTRYPEKNTRRSQAPTFFEFTVSGMDADAGQSLLPFIDLQDITTNPPAPLSGISLYHRSIKNSGGFLAIKLYTYEYEHHLNTDDLFD